MSERSYREVQGVGVRAEVRLLVTWALGAGEERAVAGTHGGEVS